METIKVNKVLEYDEALKVAKTQGLNTIVMVKILADGTTEIKGWK